MHFHVHRRRMPGRGVSRKLCSIFLRKPVPKQNLKGRSYIREPTCIEVPFHQIRGISSLISNTRFGVFWCETAASSSWFTCCKWEHPLQNTSQIVTQARMEPSLQEVMWSTKADIEGGHVPVVEVLTAAPHQPAQSKFRAPLPGSTANPPHDSPSLSSSWVPSGGDEGFLPCRTQTCFSQ